MADILEHFKKYNLPRTVLKIPRSYLTSASKIPEQHVGNWRIKKTVTAPGYYLMEGIKGYGLYYLQYSIPTTLLQEKRGGKWHDVMTDQPLYWYAMESYAQQCYGNVLVGGLGLGLIIHHLVKNLRVRLIKIVEISPNVIKMISPYLPSDSRIQIVNGDFFKVVSVMAKTGLRFESAVLDLWTGSGTSPKVRALLMRTQRLMQTLYPTTRTFYHGVIE